MSLFDSDSGETGNVGKESRGMTCGKWLRAQWFIDLITNAKWYNDAEKGVQINITLTICDAAIFIRGQLCSGETKTFEWPGQTRKWHNKACEIGGARAGATRTVGWQTALAGQRVLMLVSHTCSPRRLACYVGH